MSDTAEDFFIEDDESTDASQKIADQISAATDICGHVLEFSPTALIFHQEQGIVYSNKKAKSLLNVVPTKLRGRHLFDFLSPCTHLDEFKESFAKAFHDENFKVELTLDICDTNQSIHKTIVYVQRIPWEGLPVVQVVINDITNVLALQNDLQKEHELNSVLKEQQKQLIEQKEELEFSKNLLERIAYFDPLTGLHNRAYALDRLDNNLESLEGKTAIIAVDIDNMKTFNESLGYDGGDSLLVQAANRLQNVVSDRGFVTRLSGDDFLVILENIRSTALAEMCIKKIQLEMSDKFIFNNLKFNTTTSIGVSLAPDNGMEAQQLIAFAQAAMGESKKRAHNSYSYFKQEKSEERRRLLELENKLRRAIERDELQSYYQPMIDLRTGRFVKAELLMRWIDANEGFISPEEFIPVSENSRLIHKLGLKAFKDAIETIAELQSKGIEGFQISVNVSPIQFEDMTFIEVIDGLLKEHNVDGSQIVVEMTEGVMMEESVNQTVALAQFKDMGMKLALDDFGTGYSSLSYLHEQNFDLIKIDKSFVQRIEEDQDSQNLVHTMIQMAQNMHLDIVAEGIETDVVGNDLKAQGTQFGQGYFWSRPLPREDFLAFIQNSQS